MNPIDAYTRLPSADDERIHPIVQKGAFSETARITIQLPKHFHVESLPDTEPIETPYGKYSLQFEKGLETLTIERTLEIYPIRIPAEEYNAWRGFYKKVVKAEGSKLVLVNKT